MLGSSRCLCFCAFEKEKKAWKQKRTDVMAAYGGCVRMLCYRVLLRFVLATDNVEARDGHI
eukprot:11173957-Lingulodinium_polyedra.AAC.1